MISSCKVKGKKSSQQKRMREVTVEAAEKIERVGSQVKTALQGGGPEHGAQCGWCHTRI